MTGRHDPHTGLHSEHGALRGEHPGRAREPVVKVHDLAWVEFEKPDLKRAELFARAFGFTTTLQTPSELHLRGTDPSSPSVLIRRGRRSRFIGSAFRAAAPEDVVRLADATGRQVTRLPESLGGVTVDLIDPIGMQVRVVSGTHERHIDGSQIFDYWRDPDGFLVEHFSDGDLFDCTLEPGWAPFRSSALAQWGPRPSKDFLGVTPRRSLRELRAIVSALREEGNEFDRTSLRGLLKVATS